jgi:hypothetical protein
MILPGYGERRDEEAGAGDHALEALEHAAARGRLHLDTVFHEEHRSYFCSYALAWVELDFDDLHVVADDFVVYLVGHVGVSFALVAGYAEAM